MDAFDGARCLTRVRARVRVRLGLVLEVLVMVNNVITSEGTGGLQTTSHDIKYSGSSAKVGTDRSTPRYALS